MKTIIIIDDSRVVLRLCKKHLGGAGYRVFTYEDVGSWNQEEVTPDLILLDVNLSQYYGDDVVVYLRERRQVTTPIYLFSSIPADELKRRAAACGADGFILKRDDLSELPAELAEVFAKHS